MSKVIIFGIGDYGRIAHHYLDLDSEHEVVGFTAHGDYVDATELNGLPIVPYEELAEKHAPGDVKMLVAAGFSKVNQVRTQIYEECKAAGYEFVTYVSSKAMVWPDLPIGENTFIFEANVVQPGVSIGNNCVLWSGNHIGHDTTIENNVFIASHAVVSGNCRIQDNVFVGVTATFHDGVTVAPKCIIGAGAVVSRDTEEGDVLSVPGTKPYKLKSWDVNF